MHDIANTSDTFRIIRVLLYTTTTNINTNDLLYLRFHNVCQIRRAPPAAGGGALPLPQMPMTDLHRMPNDLDPVKLYRKTILVFIIVTAHPRDYDS